MALPAEHPDDALLLLLVLRTLVAAVEDVEDEVCLFVLGTDGWMDTLDCCCRVH